MNDKMEENTVRGGKEEGREMIFTRVVAERDVNERGVCNLAENGFAFHRNEVDALLSVAYRVSYEPCNGTGKIKKGRGWKERKNRWNLQ